MKRIAMLSALAVSAAVLFAPAAEAQTPRPGGTLRMTAPYASSFGSLDPHASGRAQDGIVFLTMHRQLYRWDSATGLPAPELITEAIPSAGGTVWTFKLRQDAFFHNGRKMTADDVVFSFTRLMDPTKGFVGARWVRLIKGAVDVEKGAAQEITGIRKIDDFTLEITFLQKVDPGYLFYNMTTSILAKEEVAKPDWTNNPVGLGPFKFVE